MTDKAADTIQALRQRVAELEVVLSKTDASLAEIGELAALKQQGEPVAWRWEQDNLTFLTEWHPDTKYLRYETLKALYTAPPAQQGEPVVWMQSDHLAKFQHHACGSQAMLARCSDHQLQGDYVPLFTAPPAQQGEPVAWLNDNNPMFRFTKKTEESDYPVFTAPPTCFSAADMADAHAKAFRDGRSVGYNEGYDDE